MNRIPEVALYPFAVGARRALPFLVIICALALTTSAPVCAEELGRLFYTPEQRNQLDIEQARSIDPAATSNVLSVNGIVQRHGGDRTVWINGVPQISGKSDEHSPESVPVAVPGQSQPVKVKVGQRVILNPVRE